MRLSAELIRLPYRFDARRVAAELATVAPSAWRPHPEGHGGTWVLPLVATAGDADDDSVTGPMLPTPHLAAMAYTKQVLAALDAPIGRTRFLRIDGRGASGTHLDTNLYWSSRVRVHLPIVTQAAVEFTCGDRSSHMAAGEVWVFDTSRVHDLRNRGLEAAFHLVVDTGASAALTAAIIGGEANPEGPDHTLLLATAGRS